MDNSFREGFCKTADAGLLGSLALGFAAPSINKRLVQNTFERSKLEAMRLPIDKQDKGLFGALGKKTSNDLNFVDKLPEGFRKKFNKFFMNEGPAAILYAPAKKGKQLGKALEGAAKEVPFLRQFLADITSVDTRKAEASMGSLTSKIKKIKKSKNFVIGGLGAALIGTLLYNSKKGNNDENKNAA